MNKYLEIIKSIFTNPTQDSTIPLVPEGPKKPDWVTETGITLWSTDPTLLRAEKIVYHLGLRGAVGNWILAVNRVLEGYDRVDAEQANPKHTDPQLLTETTNA